MILSNKKIIYLKNEQYIKRSGTAYNSSYMVPLRSTQIFASLHSAKTSYSREPLYENGTKSIPVIHENAL